MTRLSHIVCLLFLLLVCSCVETIVMDPEEDLPVAVYCVLQEEDTQVLELYFVKGKAQEGFIPVTEAEISVISNGDRVASFQKEGGARWSANFRPEYGKSYRLEILIPGHETISAETRMPDDFEVFCYSPRDTYQEPYAVFSYELRREYRIPGKTVYTEPFLVKCNLWVFPLNQWVFFPDHVSYNELIATDHPNADLFNVSGLALGDLPCFQDSVMARFPSNYQLFQRWFPAFYPDLPMCRSFVHINQPAMFDNGQDIWAPTTIHYSKQSFILATDFITEFEYRPLPSDPRLPWAPSAPGYNFYEFYSVSDELDQYLKFLYVKDFNQNDITMLYRTENVYSNVQNGMGIFGARMRRMNTTRRSAEGFGEYH